MALENKKITAQSILLSLSLLYTVVLYAEKHENPSDIAIKNTVINKKKKSHASPDIPKTDPRKNSKNITFATTVDQNNRYELHLEKRTINNIYIVGNNKVSNDAILHKLPFKIGNTLNINELSTLLKNIYSIGSFTQIRVYSEKLADNKVNIFITVEEKPNLVDTKYVGNKSYSEKELNEELKISKISTIVKEELQALVSKLKKFYQKKHFHHTEVSAKIIPIDDDHVSIEFDIKEGKKSYLTEIAFTGNKLVPSKKLKKVIFSREDWILGPLDKSGTYNPEMIEGDKAMIEDLYKSNGFIYGKVVDVKAEKHPETNNYHLTYHIHEGDIYRIKEINIPGNETLSEDELKRYVPIRPGQPYSIRLVRDAIETLRLLWGEHGYIFSDIEPVIDANDEDKTVKLTFHSDLKKPTYLNRINIKGNKKSKDHIIRRNLILEEGELITNKKMEASKARVGLLNYFDQKDGVNWKTTRIDDDTADLDLLLKEVKTGSAKMQIGYGGSPKSGSSAQSGLHGGFGLADRNLFGTGLTASVSTEISKKTKTYDFAFGNPWLFDKPIRGNISAYHRRSEYEDEIKLAQDAPFEKSTGGYFSGGYVTKRLGGLLIEGQLGFEEIKYEKKVIAAQFLTTAEKPIAQFLLDKNFQSGNQYWFLTTFSKDQRNGTVFPTHGHQWNWTSQIALPITNCGFKYFKTTFDISWYTPIIEEYSVILCLHGHLGFIRPLSGKQVPWKHLFHIGGPATIRGYNYGQVGPVWKTDSLGSTKAFFVNAELIIPVTSDLNTRAVIFYDGGAGWDMPYKNEICKNVPAIGDQLQNNSFFYRHTIGIGIRIKSPTPIQVDWGIKLNPDKRFKNNLTEMHLTMEHSF